MDETKIEMEVVEDGRDMNEAFFHDFQLGWVNSGKPLQ